MLRGVCGGNAHEHDSNRSETQQAPTPRRVRRPARHSLLRSGCSTSAVAPGAKPPNCDAGRLWGAKPLHRPNVLCRAKEFDLFGGSLGHFLRPAAVRDCCSPRTRRQRVGTREGGPVGCGGSAGGRIARAKSLARPPPIWARGRGWRGCARAARVLENGSTNKRSAASKKHFQRDLRSREWRAGRLMPRGVGPWRFLLRSACFKSAVAFFPEGGR